jgi:hypothetical protein
MTRTATYLGSPKTIAAGVVQTLTWTSSDIDAAGVTQYTLAMQPGGTELVSLLDRVRVRAAGQVIMEATIAQLQAYQQKFSRANVGDLSAGATLSIPLNLLDGPTMEARDQCQFPPGAEAQVEVVTLATAVAGTAILGWKIAKQAPKYFQRFLTAQGNIPASTKNGKFVFSDSGIIRAIIMTTAGVDRAELTISGQRAFNLPGPQFQGLVYGDLLSAVDYLEDGSTITTSRAHPVELMIPGASGTTNLILDTGAGWGGATTEIAVVSIDSVANFRGLS